MINNIQRQCNAIMVVLYDAKSFVDDKVLCDKLSLTYKELEDCVDQMNEDGLLAPGKLIELNANGVDFYKSGGYR